MMVVFFYIFALMSLIGASLVITSKNPVHSVLWLIFTFCNGSGLMVLIGAEFLAMMLIIIYVGAVAVLFLFVVMMLNVTQASLKSIFSREFGLSFCIALLLFFDLILVIFVSVDNSSSISTPAFVMSKELSDVKLIGRVLYTDFMLPFQTAGMILFVAMVASIALTLRFRTGVKKQNVGQQLAHNKQNSLHLAKNDGKMGLNNLSYDD